MIAKSFHFWSQLIKYRTGRQADTPVYSGRFDADLRRPCSGTMRINAAKRIRASKTTVFEHLANSQTKFPHTRGRKGTRNLQ